MLIGKVVGDVVATQKTPSHIGRKILLVQPLKLDGSDRGETVLALDSVDAGVGDRVLLIAEGYSAMTAVGRPKFSDRHGRNRHHRFSGLNRWRCLISLPFDFIT